jgi:hypothetical protein
VVQPSINRRWRSDALMYDLSAIAEMLMGSCGGIVGEANAVAIALVISVVPPACAQAHSLCSWCRKPAGLPQYLQSAI